MATQAQLENPITLTATGGGYSPGGWLQWPDDIDFSFQFIRILAGAQDGASTVGECFQTAGRINARDWESWHVEWTRIGDASRRRAEEAEVNGFAETAKANWMRATNYYRSAEFFLDPKDPRRLATFDKVEECSRHYLALLEPQGEVLKIPFGDDGAHIDAYFLKTPLGEGPRPAVIAFGGLDEYKDELIQEMAKYALPRGFSLLLIDLPGQGGPHRRQHLVARPDTEVPVAACVDYLLGRVDVDPDRIGLYGASLGGYYSARAASFEHRFKCAVVDGAQFKLEKATDRLKDMGSDSVMLMHAKWVFGCETIQELREIAKGFNLEGVANNIQCPLLIVHGQEDVWGAQMAQDLYDHTRDAGVDVVLKWFTAEETGAQHCQVDNPTLGMEYICDWLGSQLASLQGK